MPRLVFGAYMAILAYIIWLTVTPLANVRAVGLSMLSAWVSALLYWNLIGYEATRFFNEEEARAELVRLGWSKNRIEHQLVHDRNQGYFGPKPHS